MQKEPGKKIPQVLFEIDGVCVGCHAYSSQGHIAVNVKKKGDRRLVIFSPDAEGLHLFDTKKIGEFSFLAWSPDARYLAMAVNTFGVIDIKNDVIEPFNLRYQSGDIAIYDMATKEIKLLPGAGEMDFVEDMPAWSPDGKELLFVKYRSEKDAPIDSMSIYRVPFNNGAGGTPEPVVIASGNGDFNYFPTYSPGGKWISFVKGAGSNGVFARKTSDIYLLSQSGGKTRRLSLNTDGAMDSWHRWSKDGHTLFFSSKRSGGMTMLYMSAIDADGNASRPVRVAGHESVKVNIPELVPSHYFQDDKSSVLRNTMDNIYIEGM
ncbi:MAG: TolB family protein [Nitrospirota bacterium]